MLIICCGLLPAFTLDPNTDSGDRLSIVGTILLTTIAF